MKTTGWSQGLDVTAGGQGIVSHAELVLLRALSDRTDLTGGAVAGAGHAAAADP